MGGHESVHLFCFPEGRRTSFSDRSSLYLTGYNFPLHILLYTLSGIVILPPKITPKKLPFIGTGTVLFWYTFIVVLFCI